MQVIDCDNRAQILQAHNRAEVHLHRRSDTDCPQLRIIQCITSDLQPHNRAETCLTHSRAHTLTVFM